ncbi:hypothetical protein B0H16DRAFT_1902466 [Mycena metata]|uniref:Uncharacterized protein n=1 Tax=Mycena metata TaxID=1033252 RepID=A0AAD7E0M3_9AGAR|nr:hypothetical protein B0H16DRAFT_1902466 [Mycena metata]
MAKAWAKLMGKRRTAAAEERRALVSTSPLPPAPSPLAPDRLIRLKARADDASRGIFPVWSFDENGDYIDDLAPEPITVPPPLSGSDDFPSTAVTTIHTVYTEPVTWAPRDFSALRSKSGHLWCTVRRRNHRLLPQRRPFPHSLPKRISTPIPAVVHAVSDDPTPLLPRHVLFADNILVPNPILTASNPHPVHADEPVPVLVLPRPAPLPWDPYQFMPSANTVLATSLPGETVYGPVQSGLALVCAREYPWTFVAHTRIAEIAWGATHPEDYDEREEVLDLLPPDQYVFLIVLAEICHLEPDFTGFVEPAIADFVNAWLAHCWRSSSFLQHAPPAVRSLPKALIFLAHACAWPALSSSLRVIHLAARPYTRDVLVVRVIVSSHRAPRWEGRMVEYHLHSTRIRRPSLGSFSSA